MLDADLTDGEKLDAKEVVATLKLHGGPQQRGRVDESVAMHASKSGKIDVFKSWNSAKDTPLLRVSQLGLKADQIVKTGVTVVLA